MCIGGVCLDGSAPFFQGGLEPWLFCLAHTTEGFSVAGWGWLQDGASQRSIVPFSLAAGQALLGLLNKVHELGDKKDISLKRGPSTCSPTQVPKPASRFMAICGTHSLSQPLGLTPLSSQTCSHQPQESRRSSPRLTGSPPAASEAPAACRRSGARLSQSWEWERHGTTFPNSPVLWCLKGKKMTEIVAPPQSGLGAPWSVP